MKERVTKIKEESKAIKEQATAEVDSDDEE